jgi:hypothetical protein
VVVVVVMVIVSLRIYIALVALVSQEKSTN